MWITVQDPDPFSRLTRSPFGVPARVPACWGEGHSRGALSAGGWDGALISGYISSRTHQLSAVDSSALGPWRAIVNQLKKKPRRCWKHPEALTNNRMRACAGNDSL